MYGHRRFCAMVHLMLRNRLMGQANRVLHASRMQDMQHGMKNAFYAATANALSDDTSSIDRGITSSCLSAACSDYN